MHIESNCKYLEGRVWASTAWKCASVPWLGKKTYRATVRCATVLRNLGWHDRDEVAVTPGPSPSSTQHHRQHMLISKKVAVFNLLCTKKGKKRAIEGICVFVLPWEKEQRTKDAERARGQCDRCPYACMQHPLHAAWSLVHPSDPFDLIEWTQQNHLTVEAASTTIVYYWPILTWPALVPSTDICSFDADVSNHDSCLGPLVSQYEVWEIR